MDLSPDEKKTVVSILKLYRSWMYQNIKDENDKALQAHLAKSLAKVSSAQKKIEASLLDTDEIAAEAEAMISQGEALVSAEMGQLKSETSSPFRDIPLEEAKILIIDDDELTRELIKGFFDDMGASNVSEAEDGDIGYEKIKTSSEPFDLIICDWKMPNLNGLDLHAKAKDEDLIAPTRFVLLTAITDEILATRALKQGMNEYITKPVDAEQFELTIRTLFPD